MKETEGYILMKSRDLAAKEYGYEGWQEFRESAEYKSDYRPHDRSVLLYFQNYLNEIMPTEEQIKKDKASTWENVNRELYNSGGVNPHAFMLGWSYGVSYFKKKLHLND